MGNLISLIRNWFIPPRKAVHGDKQINSTSSIAHHDVGYSWEKREKSYSGQSYLKEFVGERIFRNLDGSHQGQCLYIQNCSDSFLIVTGVCDTVFIDDCCNCKIVLGPVKRSVFLRNCSTSLIACICGQFRTRDCEKLTCFLSCTSQPTIEASSGMRFNCVSISFPNLKDQLMRTAHNPQRNRWFEIFDFTPSITPSGVNSNWALLNAEERIESFLSREEQHFCQEAAITFLSSDLALLGSTCSARERI